MGQKRNDHLYRESKITPIVEIIKMNKLRWQDFFIKLLDMKMIEKRQRKAEVTMDQQHQQLPGGK